MRCGRSARQGIKKVKSPRLHFFGNLKWARSALSLVLNILLPCYAILYHRLVYDDEGVPLDRALRQRGNGASAHSSALREHDRRFRNAGSVPLACLPRCIRQPSAFSMRP